MLASRVQCAPFSGVAVVVRASARRWSRCCSDGVSEGESILRQGDRRCNRHTAKRVLGALRGFGNVAKKYATFETVYVVCAHFNSTENKFRVALTQQVSLCVCAVITVRTRGRKTVNVRTRARACLQCRVYATTVHARDH